MWSFGVPNAPCGVERVETNDNVKQHFLVPNAPCGVESRYCQGDAFISGRFLMHRVELKVATSL